MSPHRKISAIISDLSEIRESEHFLVRYSPRNPRHGKGNGTGGVRDEKLIDLYIDGLEMVYQTMTTPPWSRLGPIIGSCGKTVAHVLNTAELLDGAGGALTSVDREGAPCIYLPCRCEEPNVEAEYRRAIAEAVHEATHVFNYREHPFRPPKGQESSLIRTLPWLWLHEGMAIFMEKLLIPGNHDFHRYMMDWIDIPETSLDAEEGWYQSGMFVCYLAREFGLDFVNDIWTKSLDTEKPLETLERLLFERSRLRFSSADTADRDVFGAGYCMDSYFVWECSGPCFEPNLFQRYKERAISHSFEISRDTPVKAEDELDHLACRYYRFYLPDSTSELEVELLPKQPGSQLKAELAVVTTRMQRGRVYTLRPIASTKRTAPSSLRICASGLHPSDVDHLVLVVSNCGLRMNQGNPSREHDDGREYRLSIVAH